MMPTMVPSMMPSDDSDDDTNDEENKSDPSKIILHNDALFVFIFVCIFLVQVRCI